MLKIFFFLPLFFLIVTFKLDSNDLKEIIEEFKYLNEESNSTYSNEVEFDISIFFTRVCSCMTCGCTKPERCMGHIFKEDKQCPEENKGDICCIRRGILSDGTWKSYKEHTLKKMMTLLHKIETALALVPNSSPNFQPPIQPKPSIAYKPESPPKQNSTETLNAIQIACYRLNLELNVELKQKVELSIELMEIKENSTKEIQQQIDKEQQIFNKLKSCEGNLEQNLKIIQELQNSMPTDIEKHIQGLVEGLMQTYKAKYRSIRSRRKVIIHQIKDLKKKMIKEIAKRLAMKKKRAQRSKIKKQKQLEKLRIKFNRAYYNEERAYFERKRWIKIYLAAQNPDLY